MPNTKGLRPPFNSETGREAQKKSAEKRRQNKQEKKTIRQAANRFLYMKVTDKKQLAMIKKAGIPCGEEPIYLDFLVASILLRTIQKGKIDDLAKLMAITGETTEMVGDQNQLDALDALLSAIGETHDN